VTRLARGALLRQSFKPQARLDNGARMEPVFHHDTSSKRRCPWLIHIAAELCENICVCVKCFCSKLPLDLLPSASLLCDVVLHSSFPSLLGVIAEVPERLNLLLELINELLHLIPEARGADNLRHVSDELVVGHVEGLLYVEENLEIVHVHAPLLAEPLEDLVFKFLKGDGWVRRMNGRVQL